MHISELSARTGSSPRSLRYYEGKGLIRGERLPNGYRDFDDDQVMQVKLVRCLLDLGFSTEDALDILALWSAVCGSDSASPPLDVLTARVAARLEEIDEQLDALREARARLAAQLEVLETRRVYPRPTRGRTTP